MPRSAIPALAVSRVLLRILIIVNVVGGVFVLALLIASFTAEQVVVDGLGMRPPNGEAAPILGMRLIMALGLAGVPIANLLFRRLLAIVRTVGSGDPFVVRNAERLRACAWAVLGLEVLHLLIGAVSAWGSTRGDPLDINWSFSPTGLLSVLLLFVLAQVFAEGAAMRDDLEGTV